MIHLIGMSHAISFLKACTSNPIYSHENWNIPIAEPRFSELALKPGILPAHSLQSFLITPASGWIAQRRLDSGTPTLAASPEYWSLLECILHQDSDIVLSFIGGNDHSVLSLVQHPRPYDFFLPSHPECPLLANYQPLPVGTIRRQLESAMENTIAMHVAMRHKLPEKRIIHIMPPPPIDSEAQIRRAPEGFTEKFTHFGISPLSFRLKYYWLQQEILQTELSRLGIELIAPPKNALNPDGSLPEKFAYGCTHANDAYGYLVAAQISDLLS